MPQECNLLAAPPRFPDGSAQHLRNAKEAPAVRLKKDRQERAVVKHGDRIPAQFSEKIPVPRTGLCAPEIPLKIEICRICIGRTAQRPELVVDHGDFQLSGRTRQTRKIPPRKNRFDWLTGFLLNAFQKPGDLLHHRRIFMAGQVHRGVAVRAGLLRTAVQSRARHHIRADTAKVLVGGKGVAKTFGKSGIRSCQHPHVGILGRISEILFVRHHRPAVLCAQIQILIKHPQQPQRRRRRVVI